jgi:L-2-hydroxyglutarate oxidase
VEVVGVPSKAHDVVVIGGGIVGLAAARAIALDSHASVVVLEAEEGLAAHQTGHNSGVIHSGLYYRPESLKAVNCTAGRDAMYRFCERNEIPHERCGKVVVATTAEQLPALEELERRGRANGLQGLERLNEGRLREIEPHVRGVGALHVPQTGIVDFTLVAEAMGRHIREREGEVRTACRVTRVSERATTRIVHTTGGDFECRHLINCAGLQCDRVARLCGVEPDLRVIPFRGEYFKLVPAKEHLVRHLVYPVPDPRFPFLGVHFTRMIHGGIEAGPNAVLAFKREGYGRLSFSPRDATSILSYAGFWRMAARYWWTGSGEMWRSLSKTAFVRALNALVPELETTDVERHGAGVRAQAVSRVGSILDDFHILEGERMLHVLNAPSPAATASLSIGTRLADQAIERFGLERRNATESPGS